MNDRSLNQKIGVLGATGYVGGRLVPRLLEKGYHVVAISRSLQKLKTRSWANHPNVSLVAANVLDRASLQHALTGVDILFYLVHSMNLSSLDFSKTDRIAAEFMKDVAESIGIERLIYLGGLGEKDPSLSKHLKSRAEVADILKTGTVPVTVLRAAMIIGSGSASFEIIRYLVDRLPVMITPRWVGTPCQPIAIRNVLNYLMGCLEVPETIGETFDIGGQDIINYKTLIQIYAEEAKLPKRWIFPVPIFSPHLSSYWIHLITPVQAVIARPLAEGLRNPVVCREHRIQTLIPQELFTAREAIRLALVNQLSHNVETHWSDAGYLPPEETVFPGDASWSGGTLYSDKRTLLVTGKPEEIWQHIIRIGGQTGWYYGDILWRIRGVMDVLMGGVGDQRGRRHPHEVLAGDALDFWRVLAVIPNKRLRLLAEMKVPGQAILDFQLEAVDENTTRLKQTAWFVPSGLFGILYWFLVTPLHDVVFSGMLRGIAKAGAFPILQQPRKV
jgi:uncharacterized protein YbjT (DUF2867 family)